MFQNIFKEAQLNKNLTKFGFPMIKDKTTETAAHSLEASLRLALQQ